MSSDAKTTLDPTENESVGDKLGYEKDSKERLPWEHYLSQYRDADPKEIATRLGISYNEAEKYFALKFLGQYIRFRGRILRSVMKRMIWDFILWKRWFMPEL